MGREEMHVLRQKLKDGEVVTIDGLDLQIDGDGSVQPGDLYVAGRNTGPHLLEAKRVNTELGVIYPTTTEYPFNIGECVKVTEAK